ncbi:DUF4870 domain-containing protein [Massilia oculi]|uniref:DUF4870 domain-containing protein n=1 Tax=Massilia hydrophila TaxID=3044279 RepID=A0ABS7Y6Y9_9BURK|nr:MULTISPECIES: DUF4870 domain-containing protein [Massilia]MCA1245374.1 DUF4870 domain-containing protein [Massilia sp. MS-15]MCA1854721.1 DUF4870 domain-containing protein [Massilia oculi]
MQNTEAVGTYAGDKTLAILVHLSGIFFGWVVPLVLYLIKKDDSDRFTAENAREALNYQITVMFLYIGCAVLSIVLIGIFLIWVVMLANLALCIVAAVKASNGVSYRYPMTLRLVN